MRAREALDMLVEFPEQPRIGPLAAGLARLVRRAPRPSDRGLVVALVPAHNEQDRIGKAIRSLDEQISKPDLTIVIADDCTDRTALAAQSAGADVFVTVGNENKRAGALNQVLDLLLPQLRDDDAILIMNADSFLAPTFVSEARRRLTEDVGGVGGVFMGLEGGGFVGLLHNTQYERYARDLSRQHDEPLVLTGAATLFSVQTLWNVVMARAAGLLPGGGSYVYNNDSVDTDGELTLALVHLGYKVIAAP
jgi:glycosyltransferase involved in cell wall biosynthesis